MFKAVSVVYQCIGYFGKVSGSEGLIQLAPVFGFNSWKKTEVFFTEAQCPEHASFASYIT